MRRVTDSDNGRTDSHEHEQQFDRLLQEVRDIKLVLEGVSVAIGSMMALLEIVQSKVLPDTILRRNPFFGASHDDPIAVGSFDRSRNAAASPSLPSCAMPFELQHEVEFYAEDHFTSSTVGSDVWTEE